MAISYNYKNLLSSTKVDLSNPMSAAGNGNKRTLLRFFMLFLLIPLFGLLIISLSVPKVEKETYANLQAIADLKTTQIKRWIKERKADSQVIFEDPGIVANLAVLTQDTDNNELEQLRVRLESIVRAYDYNAITLLNIQGNKILNVGDPRHESFFHFSGHKELMRQASETGQVQYGNFFYDKANDTTCMFYVIPLFHSNLENGTPNQIGTVVLHITPTPFLFPYIQTWPVNSASAETLLVRRIGESVLFMNKLRHRKDSAMKLHFPLNSPTLPAAIAINHNAQGITEGKDHRNIEVLAAYQPISGTDWHIIAKIDRDEALQPLFTLAWQISIIIFAALSILSVLLWRHWRQQKYIYNLLLEKQKTKANHLLQQFFNLPFIGMAIVSAETQEWIRFNNNFATILGYSNKEINQRNWLTLIHPDDRKKSLIRIIRIIRGRADNYVGNIRLLRKDATSIITNINISWLQKPDESINHFIIAVQDVTKQKQVELKLTQFKYTLDQTLDGVMICSAEDFRFIYVNQGAINQLGYSETELLQMTPLDIRPDMNLEKYQQIVQPLIDGTKPSIVIESLHRHKDGHEFPVETSLQFIQDKTSEPRFIAIIKNITQRKINESRIQRLSQIYAILSQCNHAIVHCSCETDLFAEICRSAVQLGGMSVAWISLLSKDKQSAYIAASYGENAKHLQTTDLSSKTDVVLKKNPIYIVIHEDRPLWRQQSDELYKTAGFNCNIAGCQSMATLPIHRNGIITGTFTVCTQSKGVINKDERNLLLKMAADISFALDNFEREDKRKLAEDHLEEKISELQRWHDATLGRETRILDLKREINKLLAKTDQPPRYPSATTLD